MHARVNAHACLLKLAKERSTTFRGRRVGAPNVARLTCPRPRAPGGTGGAAGWTAPPSVRVARGCPRRFSSVPRPGASRAQTGPCSARARGTMERAGAQKVHNCAVLQLQGKRRTHTW